MQSTNVIPPTDRADLRIVAVARVVAHFEVRCFAQAHLGIALLGCDLAVGVSLDVASTVLKECVEAHRVTVEYTC